jgi:hypothetical protein
MKKKYQKWNDYELAIIIAHHRRFGVSNKESLYNKIPGHSIGSINCEIGRFNNFIKRDCLEFGYPKNITRPGSRKRYIRIIDDLSI